LLCSVLAAGAALNVPTCPACPILLDPHFLYLLSADHKVLVIAEADHAAIPLSQREDLKQQQQPAGMDTDDPQQQQQNGAAGPAAAGPEADEETAAREEQFGAPKGEPGQWASCVR